MHDFGKITSVAVVVFRASNIPAKFPLFAKRCAGIGRDISNNLGTSGEWSAIEIEIAIEGNIGRERRVNTGRAEEIQCQTSVREKAIPFNERKRGIDCAED
jgi:hypothetical protein